MVPGRAVPFDVDPDTVDDLLGISARVHEAVAGVQQALLWGLDVHDCRGLALDALLEVSDSTWSALGRLNAVDGAPGLAVDIQRHPRTMQDLPPATAAPAFLATCVPYVHEALTSRAAVCARLPRPRPAARPLHDLDWLAVLPIPGGSSPAACVLLARRGAGLDDGHLAALDPLVRLLGQIEAWTREVAARRQAERELEHERRRLTLALAASDVGVFEFDPRTGAVQWDARLWAMHGLEPRETWSLGEWAALLHPEDAHRAIDDLLAAVDQRHVLQTQYRMLRPDGDLRHVRCNAQVFEHEGATRVVGVNMDVTVDVRLQQELAAERAQAEAATRAKSQFLAVMSHEIRTPMNGVLGMLELLLRSDLAPEQHERAVTAHASAECLLRILNDILDLSKLESQQVAIEAIPFQPARVIRETVALLVPRAAEKHLAVRKEIAADLPAWICGDPMRVRQVLLNLTGNAIKFTAAGHVTVRAALVRVAGVSRLRVEVADTGEGIAEDAQARLFQQFVQADSSTSRRFGGTGLGLAISRQLVQLMGGEIGVHSRAGEGSTFWFELPAIATVAPQPAAPTAAVAAPETPLPPLRILAVDDNAVNRRIVQAYLAPGRHRVRLVESGAEALEALSRDVFDVVLMDVQMPVMDGPTCLRHIRALDDARRDVPVIALTADAMAGDRERFLAEGFSDYVSKPMTMQTLAAALARVTARRPS